MVLRRQAIVMLVQIPLMSLEICIPMLLVLLLLGFVVGRHVGGVVFRVKWSRWC